MKHDDVYYEYKFVDVEIYVRRVVVLGNVSYKTPWSYHCSVDCV